MTPCLFCLSCFYLDRSWPERVLGPMPKELRPRDNTIKVMRQKCILKKENENEKKCVTIPR